MICGNCKEKFDGKNFGVFVGDRVRLTGVPAGSAGKVAGGTIVDACRPNCAAALKTKAREALNAANARPAAANAATGAISSGEKKKPRKLSPSEILRRSRPSETSISKAIGDKLDAAGTWNTRTQSGNLQTKSGHYMKLCREGTPDRVFNYGLNVWIEVKREGESATPVQLETIARLRANGSLAFVLDNADDLKFILSGLREYAETIEAINVDIGIIQNAIDFELLEAKEGRRNGK